jgi:hypothetical protein
MPAGWINVLARIYGPLSIAAALLVVIDIFWIGRRQKMAIMDAVWPLSALYWGPPGLLFYGWFGRARQTGSHEPPMWQAVFKGAAHCGAGCALGDFLGDWLTFGTGFALFGSRLGGDYAAAFVLAYLFGIVFQYFSVAPMRGLGVRDGLTAAIKADTLSLLAYEVGMFAAMGARAALYPQLRPTVWSYWLLMQVAMVIGFATTCPVNWWLIRRGVKERM